MDAELWKAFSGILVDTLTEYSWFLEHKGYTDTDWREEGKNSVEIFLDKGYLMKSCTSECDLYPMGEYCIDCKHYIMMEKRLQFLLHHETILLLEN